MTKLGRNDVIIKMPLLSSQLELPREEHLDVAVHTITYVGQKNNSTLVNDPSYQDLDHNIFKKCDWSEFYWDTEEVISMNALGP